MEHAPWYLDSCARLVRINKTTHQFRHRPPGSTIPLCAHDTRIFFVTRQVDGRKKCSNYTVLSYKPPENAQNSKISACMDPKPTVILLSRGKRAVSRSSSQEVVKTPRLEDCNAENIREYLESRGQPGSRGSRKALYSWEEAGQGIYILENILEYESLPDPLYSQRYSRITCLGQTAVPWCLTLYLGPT